MEIFKDFGVNPILLVAQIINFLIVLFLLKRFMYKPVLDVLKKREEQIKNGLKDAQDAEKKLLDAEEKEKQIIHKAKESAEKIISGAKSEAAEIRTFAEESAKKESEKILVLARETIAQEEKAAEERLTKKIGKIALTLLEKSLTGLFGEKEQKIILKKATSVLEKQNTS